MAEKEKRAEIEAEVPVSELVRALDQLIQTRTSGVAESVAEGISRATNRDDRDYEQRSVFNPLGEKAHPRPPLTQEIWWAGYKLQESELMREEIEALNALQPGTYGPNGQWTVRDMEPGTLPRKLMVKLPSTHEGRVELIRYDRGRGLVDLLEEVFQVRGGVPA